MLGRILLVLVLVNIVLFSGCGQTGDLYLPAPPATDAINDDEQD